MGTSAKSHVPVFVQVAAPDRAREGLPVSRVCFTPLAMRSTTTSLVSLSVKPLVMSVYQTCGLRAGGGCEATGQASRETTVDQKRTIWMKNLEKNHTEEKNNDGGRRLIFFFNALLCFLYITHNTTERPQRRGRSYPPCYKRGKPSLSNESVESWFEPRASPVQSPRSVFYTRRWSPAAPAAPRAKFALPPSPICFRKGAFIRNSHAPSFHGVRGCFERWRRQCRAIVTETIWPTELEVFAV